MERRRAMATVLGRCGTAGRCLRHLCDTFLWKRETDIPRLAMAYNYFYNEISNYVNCADSPTVDAENKIYGLFQALRTGLVLVVIELEENDDPQVIFETLNARGQPLLPSDLIRNTIFYQASNDPLHTGDDTYADQIYNNYWRHFDDRRVPSPIAGEDR